MRRKKLMNHFITYVTAAAVIVAALAPVSAMADITENEVSGTHAQEELLAEELSDDMPVQDVYEEEIAAIIEDVDIVEEEPAESPKIAEVSQENSPAAEEESNQEVLQANAEGAYTFGEGAAQTNLLPGTYTVTAKMLKETTDLGTAEYFSDSNLSMASGALAGNVTVVISENGSTTVTVPLQPVTFLSLTAWGADWTVYQSYENYALSEGVLMNVDTQDASGNATQVSFVLPYRNHNGVYISAMIDVMGYAPKMAMAFDWKTAVVVAPEVEDIFSFGSGSGKATLTANTYDVPVKLMNASKDLTGDDYFDDANKSHAADSIVGDAQLQIDAEGNTKVIVNTGSISMYGITAWATDWSVYASYTDYASSTLTPATVEKTDADGNVTQISFPLPYKNQNAIYISMTSGGRTSNAALAFRWTDAKITVIKDDNDGAQEETDNNKPENNNDSNNTNTNTTVTVTKPAQVKTLSLTNKSNKHVTVKWSKVSDATGYVVYRSTKKSSGYKAIKTITKATTVQFTNSNLTQNKTYYYKVRAYKKASGKTVYGNYSPTKSITLIKVPTRVKSLKLANSKTRKVTISWKKVSGATGYIIYRSTKKNSGYKAIKTIKKNSTVKYTNSKLKKGRTYYYKVRAYKQVNGKKAYGKYSTIKKVTVKK